jgi:hypothetical protein
LKVAGVAVEIDTTLLLSLAADARPLWQGETPQTGPCLGVQYDEPEGHRTPDRGSH